MRIVIAIMSVKRPAISSDGDHEGYDHEKRNRPEVDHHLGETIAFQEYAPHKTQEMSEGESRTDPLSPFGHTPEGEHEAGKHQ